MNNYNKINQYGSSYRWSTLEHNGVLFPEEYKPHNIPLKYNNEKIKLEPLQEETAMLYSKYINTDYITNKTFNRNFWNDWKKILGKDNIIKDLSGCDFTEYFNKLQEDKNLQKNIITVSEEDELKLEEKLSRVNYQISEEEEKIYKIALVDGVEQPVGNYRMEPPGIFLGRGDNPNLGKIKPRIYPEDVIINIGKESSVPKTIKGHKWKKIIHNRHVEWLSSWKDKITGKTKYLWLAQHSTFKSSSDQDKFDLARKLKRKIESIRNENLINLNSDNIKLKQIATAFYFIDNFALRVGGEKGDDTADTVGVSTLRVEHIELLENNTIILDFLGKDSVRYYNKIQVSDDVYRNILEFTKDKNKNDNIFDFINSSDINRYLQKFMANLTAKVFRTYNGSYLFQKEIKKIYNKYDRNTDLNILIDEFNKANAIVAKKLNHQKNVGKSFKGQVDKIDQQIKKIKYKLKKSKKSSGETKAVRIIKLSDKLKKLKLKKQLKQEMKNISLGTSKQNYLDPRISIAFIKTYNIPIDKIFNKSLQDKFKWALDIDVDYKF